MTGPKLRELRVERGLTQADIGERIGVTKQGVSSIESQERPLPETVGRYLRALYPNADIAIVTEYHVGDATVYRSREAVS